MTFNILERINHGYGELEPVVLGLLAMRLHLLVTGRHGTGKTRLATVLSSGIGSDKFVAYDAPKDDLITVAGIPEIEGASDGPFTFRRHKRTIWDKQTILIDEITRAGRESQNLWLEILENRACFGEPLPYEALIATANPESYEAAFKLDEALLDRFHAVVPVPEFQVGVNASDVTSMIQLGASDPASLPSGTEIAEVLREIRTAHEQLLQEGLDKKVENYLGALVEALFPALPSNGEHYVSPRTYSRQLFQSILAIAAYFRASGATDFLERGAKVGLRYGLSTKLLIKPGLLDQLHRTFEGGVPPVRWTPHY